jgi:hypothetical protein
MTDSIVRYNLTPIFFLKGSNPKNHVIYGNVLYRTGLTSSRVDATATDAIRIANSMGDVYVADNVVVGYNSVCDKCRGFGGATDPTSVAELSSELTSRVLLEGNMFAQSQLTIGAYGAPSQENIVHSNWFGESELQVGQAAPTQTEVTDNVVVWAYLDSRYVWGDGDAAYGAAPKPTIIRGNTVFFAPVDGDIGRENDLPALDLGTAAYAYADDKTRVGARPELGKAPLPASLVVDSNTYGGPSTFFRLNAGGVMSKATTLDEWRMVTRNAGKECDTSSSIVTPPNNTVQVIVRPNLYSPYRAHVLIFNYGSSGNATIPLGVFAAIRMPMKFAVYRASEQWSGQPVIEGALPSSEVKVTLNATQRVSTYVVVANDGKDPEFPPRCVDPNAPGCDPCPRFDEGCADGLCRQGECLTTTLFCNKNGYCEEIGMKNEATSIGGGLIGMMIAMAMMQMNA